MSNIPSSTLSKSPKIELSIPRPPPPEALPALGVVMLFNLSKLLNCFFTDLPALLADCVISSNPPAIPPVEVATSKLNPTNFANKDIISVIAIAIPFKTGKTLFNIGYNTEPKASASLET